MLNFNYQICSQASSAVLMDRMLPERDVQIASQLRICLLISCRSSALSFLGFSGYIFSENYSFANQGSCNLKVRCDMLVYVNLRAMWQIIFSNGLCQYLLEVGLHFWEGFISGIKLSCEPILQSRWPSAIQGLVEIWFFFRYSAPS